MSLQGLKVAMPACPAAARSGTDVPSVGGRRNLLQAHRDFFGAHSCERTDKPEGQFFHTQWPDVID